MRCLTHILGAGDARCQRSGGHNRAYLAHVTTLLYVVDARSCTNLVTMEHFRAMTRVAFIGAGSIEFTRNVVTDLCVSELGVSELGGELRLALHDISAERLAFADRLVRQIVAQTGSTATVTASASRAEALRDATYVINEIQVGGYAATRFDFDLPARYGVRQTIADTIGIGGIFRGLRTIPVAVSLAEDMLRYCPGAYLLNYTNPMAMLPWAVYEGTEFDRVFGLCHSVRDTHAFLAGLVDADPELARRVRVQLFRRFGYFPTESSEHSAEYVPWFIRHDAEVERFRIFVGDYLARSEENLRELDQLSSQLAAGEPLELEPTRELASQFIYSCETGAEQEIYVNVRNGGLIENLPANACVEVPCDLGSGGPTPRPVGSLPVQLAALNRTFLNVVELTVKAVLTGSRDHVYQAALLDPNTSATLTTDQTVALCDELLEAHSDLLPAALRS